MWPSGTPNPYVWSFEGTAAGTHADYMFGWKGDSLQRAMNKSECFYDGCGSITKQQMSVANQCSIKLTVQEETDGCMSRHSFAECHSLTFHRARQASRHVIPGLGWSGFVRPNRGPPRFFSIRSSRSLLFRCHRSLDSFQLD